MTIYEADHELFRDSFRAFAEHEMAPHVAAWERDGIMDRAVYVEAGKHGFLGMAIPEEFGGGGVDGLPVQRGAQRGVCAAEPRAVEGSG